MPQLLKPAFPRACAPQQENPLQLEAHAPQLEEPPLTAIRGKLTQHQRLSTAKVNKEINKIIIFF